MVKEDFFTRKITDSQRFHIDDPFSSHKVAQALFSLLPDSPAVPVAVINIGSDRSTGDALGPLTGTKLHDKCCPHFHIFGTLDKPVHAKNLVETLSEVKQSLENPFIIAVDACLGRTENVGKITVAEGPVIPGAAVRKKLPPVGHAHITGIVNVGGYMEMLVLQNTRLSLVMTMADKIASSIRRTALWHSDSTYLYSDTPSQAFPYSKRDA